ncbi:M48 family metallopeptidase [Poseidonocella sedimentorum]|uniref:Peptidase family M48 n=1 Tax=Poseidonocella sedimentorum TaxID=871652 RepID=A0A1I6EQ50_9RHOB|nr:M48 family metallopeptidase [Poseidonocella sedimentorum]SFR19850.1 Peptidase family M48 [Poseidonocella sedimentorum]
MRITSILLAGALLLSGCGAVTVSTPSGGTGGGEAPSSPVRAVSAETATRNFSAVVRSVEPVAESECRRRTSGVNCDFRILVDDRAGVQANAFQTLDENGRPIVVFTVPLILAAENRDELAFVLGHETAHHIAGHIRRQQGVATLGAAALGGIAAMTGASSSGVEAAQRLGAQVGGRIYSKDFELEADALGTVITDAAGYDPVRGALFFNRIPDPGDRFLGTHPPNAQRMEIVRRTAAAL